MKSTKLTNSFKTRVEDNVVSRQLTKAARQISKGDSKTVSFSEITSLFNHFIDFLAQKNSTQKKEVLFKKIYSIGIVSVDEKLEKCITKDILGGFHLGLIVIANTAITEDIALIQSAIRATEEALEKGLVNASALDIQTARGSCHQFRTHLAALNKNNYIISLCIEAYGDFLDALDVQENICSSRFLYQDNYLAISWFPSCVEDNEKLKPTGDLTVAVKRPNGLWSFDKYSDTRIPVASLRRARECCLQWRGQKMTGQITHAEAERIAKFLGFKIQGKFAYLIPTKSKGFGRK
ncbi:MAG TPA: hypothetical protein V6D33_05570 [Cyanophyceae cyanobacterium]